MQLPHIRHSVTLGAQLTKPANSKKSFYMLKLINKFFGRRNGHSSEPNTIVSGDHPLKPGMISRNARSVVETLQQAGFEAYIVGGSVRDLLLGMHPKDFDVATNAKPGEIKPLFRRSRIVGRRFQIVHVQFGREIIEVTTFRANDSDEESRHRQQSASGVLTRDNIFGSLEDDALRRDLTINALYYDPSDNSIHDFAGGLRDIEARTIHMIGDPAVRYREDPVRMLRVARFAAKLGFQVEKNTERALLSLVEHLSHVSSPRLFDESLKLFMSGQGLATFHILEHYGLLQQMIPALEKPLRHDPLTHPLIEQAFTNTDRRIRADKRVTPAFIYAALLWPAVVERANALTKKGDSPAFSISKAGGQIVAQQIPITAIPRRFTLAMREIWDMQLRLDVRSLSRAERLLEHPRFRAAYDFILLREEAGEDLGGLGSFWTKYQDADEKGRQHLIDQRQGGGQKTGRNRRRRRRKPAPKKDS